MRAINIFLTFAIISFGAGCASNVRQNVVQPVQAQVGNVQNIYLVISAPPSVASGVDYAQSAAELRDAIDEKLRATMPSARLVSGNVPPTSGIKVNLVIEDFRFVSGAARFLTGIISGNARLGVRVEIFNLQTAQKIGESTFGTSSSASEGILGGTTSRQIEAVADSIVKMVSNKSI